MIGTEKAYPLAGFNIGVSGAVPERSAWIEPALDRAILEFVSTFSGLVLQYGGRIVHGTHPTFTPVVLRQAQLHHLPDPPKPVTLVMSALWAKTMDSGEAARYGEVAELLVTKQVGGGGPENIQTRNDSLTLMRAHLLQQMNAMMAIGGKLHEEDGIVPGVLEEVKLANQRRMATFLIGGMGGATAKMAQEYAHALPLDNGLTPEQNIQLLTTSDIASCVSTILNHLITHQELAARALAQLGVRDDDCVPYAVFKQRETAPG